MSCQFKLFASVVDIDRVKSCLFTGECTSSEVVEGEDSWNWTVDEPVSEDWLEECHVSLSPSSELLVFARERNLVILNGKWDSDKNSEGKINYHIAWKGDITQEYVERITSVLCLPLAGQGKLSTHGGADWTAVAVGFSTGAIRFYTENGSLLLSELLHEEPVKSIKCQTFQPHSNPHVASQVDELHVGHKTVVCSIQGFALCNSLKHCRNQLARDICKLVGDSVRPLQEDEEYFNSKMLISVGVKKGEANKISICGLAIQTSGIFQYPQEVSILVDLNKDDGNKTVESGCNCPAGNNIQTISQARGWLGVNKKAPVEKQKEKTSLEPAEAMSCRFGLCDFIRKGQRIYMSPQKNLGVVCDSLGRVILLDTHSGIALRMWKGYRDAECAFIPVDEDKGSGSSRKALYLAIYAPKKAIVEVWALQQGPKITSFVATKNGRLLYIKHGLMGANNISPKNVNSSQHPCIYISSSGDLKQVCVPFHLILNNKNDPRNRDLYLFKQIKRFLRTSFENSSTEIPELCKQISSEEFKLQVLETAASSKYITPSLMESIINEFQNVPTEESDSQSEVPIKCRIACGNYKKLVSFYVKALQCLDVPPEYSTVVPSSPTDDEEILSKMLKLSIEEVQRLLILVSFSTDSSKVSFQSVDNRFPVFLSNFINICSTSERMCFPPNITINDMSVIGEILCQCVLYGGCSLADWMDLALESSIEPKCLLYSSVAYWLKKPLGINVRSEMTIYVQLLFLITSLLSMTESLTWWDQVRSFIMESEYSLNALTSTIISRAVYLRTEKQITDEGLLDEEDENWETISRETCLWSQLLMQVEAVAVLQTALSRKPMLRGRETKVPVLDYVRPDISLANLLLKGPGLVAESVAKYVSSWGMQPEWFLNLEEKEIEMKTDEDSSVQIDASAEAMTTTSREDIVFQRLELIKKYFPYSLTPSHILANLCWEYVSVWAKKPDETDVLATGISCLDLIPDHALKLGLCAVLWSVHLKTHFENIVKLLQKIGKLPKDRLCTQHANLPAPCIQHVLQSLVDFFEIFIEGWPMFFSTLLGIAKLMQPQPSRDITNHSIPMAKQIERNLTKRYWTGSTELIKKFGEHLIDRATHWVCNALVPQTLLFKIADPSATSSTPSDEETALIMRKEAIWTNDCQPSLVDISLAQGDPHMYILKTQCLCAKALQFFAVLPIRLHRPVTSLLHNIEESMLWMDIRHSDTIPAPTPDARVEESRLVFLLKVINAATDVLCSQEMALEDASHWIGQCYALASDWEVPADSIRIQQVINLYKNNGDRFAEEVVGSVNNKAKLGAELLVVVGQRMKTIIVNSSRLLGDRMAHLSPALSNWIQEQEESKEMSELKDVIQLSALVVSLLPESSPDHRFASLLLEGIQPLAA